MAIKIKDNSKRIIQSKIRLKKIYKSMIDFKCEQKLIFLALLFLSLSFSFASAHSTVNARRKIGSVRPLCSSAAGSAL